MAGKTKKLGKPKQTKKLKKAVRKPARPPKQAAPDGLSVDFRSLPVPEHSCYADRCIPIDRGMAFEFAFLEARLGEEGRLVSRVVVDVFQLVNTIVPGSRGFTDAVKPWLDERGLQVERVELGGKAPPVEDTPVYYCNVIRMTRANLEATMDCHYVPPIVVHEAKQGRRPKKIAVPVIRIQLSIMLLLGLLELLESILPELRSRLGLVNPEEQENDDG